MHSVSSTLPWGLSFEAVTDLIGLAADTSITIVEPSRPFGGYTGEKALLQVESWDTTPQWVLLKRTRLTWAQREVKVYQALTSADAPVVTCYGLCSLLDDQAVVAVEYLPYAIDWPISPELHIAWAVAAATFARCPLPETVELPQVRFLLDHDAILAGLEAAVQDPDQTLQAALAETQPDRIFALACDTLASFLAEVDALPRGLTHGECYPMHMGRRTLDGLVLFFDVTSAAIRPRFYDVQGLIVDHGEPYEIGDVTPVLRRYWQIYDPSLSWEVFRREVALMEGLVALRTIGLHMHLLHQGRGEAWQNAEEASLGHIKWIRLSLAKAGEVLTMWSRHSLRCYSNV